ncbi:hypothetical protein [Sphingopyxis fribergensis]
MADQCFLFGMYAFPGGSCAQWFSGSASATAVAVAVGAHFFTAWRQRKSEERNDAAEVAGIAMLLYRALQETAANIDILRKVGRSISVWDKEYRFCRPLGAVKATNIPPPTNKNSDVLIRNGKSNIATEIDRVVGNINLANIGIEELSRMRLEFDPIFEKYFSSGTNIHPPKEDPESELMRRRLIRISTSFDYFLSVSDTIFSDTFNVSKDFNAFCSEKYIFNVYQIDLKGFEKLLKTSEGNAS